MKTKEGQRFKVSFCAFVQGKQLQVAEMNTIIGWTEFQGPGVLGKAGVNTLGVLGAGTVTGRDAGPYTMGCTPKKGLTGDEEVMEVPWPKGASRSIARSEMHSVDAAVGHSAEKPDWLTITDESMRELASDYMFAAKMKNFRLGKITGNAIAVLNEPGKLRYCVHVETHRSNNASILFFKDHRVMYNCYSSKCIDQEAHLLGALLGMASTVVAPSHTQMGDLNLPHI
ncbi:g2559 [Coccomyxa elongata]